jgi:ubiquitin C-terminal hydrolase
MSELLPPEPHDQHHKPKKSARSGSKGRAPKHLKKANDAVGAVNTQEEVKAEPKPVKEPIATQGSVSEMDTKFLEYLVCTKGLKNLGNTCFFNSTL